jgi:hypothetical protein
MATVEKPIKSVVKNERYVILGLVFKETSYGLNYYKENLLNKKINQSITIIEVDGYPSNFEPTTINLFLKIDKESFNNIDIGTVISITI